MAIARGTLAVFSVIKGTTWGTAGTVDAASKGIRVTSWSVDEGVEPLLDNSYNASPGMRQSTLVSLIKPSGTFEFDLKYEGCDIIQALFFGTAGVPTGVGPYLHTWTVKSDMTGVFASMAWYDELSTYTVTSAKFTGISYSSTAGGAVKCKVSWKGHKYTRAAANNLSNLTEPTNIDRVQMIASVATYSIAAQGASLGAFAPGLADWSVDITRDYNDWVTSTLAPYPDEFVSDRLNVKGKITIAPKSAVTYPNLVATATAYKLKFAHILTSVTKEWHLWIPHVQFVKADDSVTPGGIPMPLEFRGDLATSSQSGYPATLVGVTAYNSRSTDALA